MRLPFIQAVTVVLAVGLTACTGPATTAPLTPGANGSPTASPSVSALPSGTSSASRPPASPSPVGPSPRPGEKVIRTAYLTGYTWFDNTPPGSAIISNPVLHKTAGGTGTYADPVTVAVGHSTATGDDVLDFAPGTRIYVPDVRRYFIVEDTCGDGLDPEDGPCHQGIDVDGSGSTVWLDLWIGGQDGGTRSTTRRCASRITGPKGSLQTVILNPAPDYVVASGSGVFHDGSCDASYGEDLVRVTRK